MELIIALQEVDARCGAFVKLDGQAMRCKLKPWTINGFPSIVFFGFDAMKMVVDREQERVFEALTVIRCLEL